MAKLVVLSAPVPQDGGLSIALVRSGQCIEGTRYAVASDMVLYFTGIVGDVVRNELRGWMEEQTPLLLEQVESGELRPVLVQYAQLKRCKVVESADEQLAMPSPDGTFQHFEAKKIRVASSKTKEDPRGLQVIMGPDGTLYEPQTKLQSKYSFDLECRTSQCTVSFRYQLRPYAMLVTCTQPVDPRIVTRVIECKSQMWMDNLTHIDFWPSNVQRAASSSQQSDAQSTSTRSESLSKYEFEQSEGQLFLVGKKSNVMVANFFITQILAIYTSVSTPPIYKVLCCCDGQDITAVLEPARYRCAMDVSAAFQQVDASLFAIDFMPAMLMAYLLSIPNKPPSSKLITYWGLQTDDVFVLGNCAFNASTGLMVETAWSVWDRTFIEDKVSAIRLEDFPRIVPMPMHVKYTVGYTLVNEICEQVFLNNYWPAMTVLAWQVVALYYPYMQKGEFGGGAGNPVLYIQGSHGTGKSSAAKMAAALSGHFGPLASGQTTMPAMMRKATTSTIPTHIEDPKFTDHEASWTQRLPMVVRTSYDGSTRAVAGKTDTPRSSFAISTNEPMPCADDTALWSRIIYVTFDELKGEPPASSLYGDFISAIKLHSALMPEYLTLARPAGGFDLCAINDFTAFLDEVTCKSRERNNSGWARVGYVMVLLIKLYQGSFEKMHALLEFVAQSCHYQATRMLGTPGIFDKFLAIVLETIARGQSILFDSDQCVYFHCYRTTITVGDEPVLALRLDWWAKYLKTKRLLDVTAAQLRDARPKEHSEMRMDVPFYDVQTSPWPPTFDGKPYTEAQMMQAALATPKPCLVISETFIHAFERKKYVALKDINSVVITSHRGDIGMYPFVQAICSGDWFGFDALDKHALAPFFMTNIALMDQLNPNIVRVHAEQALPRVDYCTSMSYLSKVFTVDGYCSDELPPCLRVPHFKFKYVNDTNTDEDDLESPTKRQCGSAHGSALRTRGGARTRAPRRAPGDNTLPTRPQLTPIRTALGKENVDPNVASETELDHAAEVLTTRVEPDEISLEDFLEANEFSLDDLQAAAEFEAYAGWSS